MRFTDDIPVITVTLLILLPLVLYIYYKKKHSYWLNRNVPFLEPSIPFGNIGAFVLRKTSLMRLLRDLYFECKLKGHKYTGIYLYARKALFISDPRLIKRILTTDFHYFHDRDIYYDEKNDPVTANLISLTGQKWKNLRAKISPTFTSGKLKTMFHTIFHCAEELSSVLHKCTNGPVEIKDLLTRFTTDVIGSCAFGIECNSLKDPNTEFRKYGKKVTRQGVTDVIKLVIYRNFPRLAKFMKLRVISADVSNFFIDVVRQTIDHREQNSVVRNDFMQLLIQLKNNGQLEADDTLKISKNLSDFKLSFNEIAAQSFLFFIAGYESSSTVTSFALYELAVHEDMQQRLREEILRVRSKYGGKITYEGIMEMAYMEQIISETVRKYPVIPFLLRKCTHDYQMPDSDVIIEKDTPIFISNWGLHSDPDYFPDPDTFDPERFHKDNTHKHPDYAYLPFGDGPRICIGQRFGMLQIKIAISQLLSHFKFTLNSKTESPLIFEQYKYVILSAADGIWLNITNLNDN